MSATAPLTDRRSFLQYFAGFGLGGTLFPGVLWVRAASGAEIDDAAIVAAAQIAGVSFTEDERKRLVNGLTRQAQVYAELQKVPLDNAVAPAVGFTPLPPNWAPPKGASKPPVRAPVHAPAVPGNLEDLAFEPVTVLGDLLKRRKVTSTRLTAMYLDRLKRLNEKLFFVVNLTEERARSHAAAADAEIARGKYRGPLHGIPWGAKDLLAVKGYPTTWGTAPLKEQMFGEDATVVKRLDDAGAVLVAKLTLGELAQGDLWFGGRTRNPWNPVGGSSGSSAGPASATSAGCVGFSIGSETRGSISSPSTVCGVTGLRPTFGRVPRSGAMTLSWSMDKLGPICRSVEDCALALAAIHGPDGRDLSCIATPFNWDATVPLAKIRVGFVKSAFDEQPAAAGAGRGGAGGRGGVPEIPPGGAGPCAPPPAAGGGGGRGGFGATRPLDLAALDVLKGLGISLIPVDVPQMPYSVMDFILTAECGAAFDEFTRSGRANGMCSEASWPNTFRSAHFIPAVEYINANRVRTLAIAKWAELFKDVDVIVVPTSGANQVGITNLTGHPACIVPNGFRENGLPASITFLGHLFGEAAALRVAHAYQQATNFHLKHPAFT